MAREDNVKGKTFKDKPERINKNGRPKYVLTQLREYLEKHYGSRPPKSEVREMMEYIECLSMEHLKEFIADKNIPVILQAYGRLLITGDQKDFRRVQAAEMINDRLHGKPKQSADITSGGNEIRPVSVDIYKLSTDVLKQLANAKISDD